jgi:hypothetical protein
MTKPQEEGRRTPAKKTAGPGDSPSVGAVVVESTTDLHRTDPGRLCIRCLRPRYPWRDVPACSCEGGPL